MALFDTNSGLGNLFGGMNIFGARQPEYLGGLNAHYHVLKNKEEINKIKS